MSNGFSGLLSEVVESCEPILKNPLFQVPRPALDAAN